MSQMNTQALELIDRWAKWRGRLKYYAPPPLRSQMEQFHQVGVRLMPDVRTDPVASWCNMAIAGLPEDKHDAFMAVYAKGYMEVKIPVKVVAGWYNVDRGTIYRYAHEAAGTVVTMTKRLSQNLQQD